jgi:hypothetical protein
MKMVGLIYLFDIEVVYKLILFFVLELIPALQQSGLGVSADVLHSYIRKYNKGSVSFFFANLFDFKLVVWF